MTDNSETSRLISQAADRILEPFTTQKENIYIDSDMLYDYLFGVLMLQVKSQKQYDYVMSRLQEYSTSSEKDITKVFPDLGITTEEFASCMKDETCLKYTAVLAPPTGLLMELADMIVSINTYNKSKDVKTPVKMYINQRIVPMPSQIRKKLVAYLRAADPTLQIIYTDYKTWDEVPTELIKKLDFIGVGDMIDFTRQGTNSQKLLQEPGSLSNAIVFAHPVCDDDITDPEERKEALANFCNVMQVMFAKFIYTTRTIHREG